MSNCPPLWRRFGCAVAVLSALLALSSSGSAMTVHAPTFATLVQGAEQIVRVKVTNVSSRWEVSGGQQVIDTYVEATVLRTLKGAETSTVTLRFLGGQVGDQRMEIPEMPTFTKGSTYILFVAGNGTAFCPLVGVSYGSFQVKADSGGFERIARASGAPLRSIEEITHSEDEAGAEASSASGISRESFELSILNALSHAPAA